MGLRTLAEAPTYAQVRKQVAVAEEGLARVAMARGGQQAAGAPALLRQSAAIWRAIVSASPEDVRSAQDLARVESLLGSVLGR